MFLNILEDNQTASNMYIENLQSIGFDDMNEVDVLKGNIGKITKHHHR